MPEKRPAYPDAPQRPVSDTYHGVVVSENYRWLETFDDPAVQAWTAAQNRLTRSILDQSPAREPLLGRFQQLYTQASPDYFALKSCAGKLFAIKRQPPKDQPLLVRLDSPDAPENEHVVLDPNVLDPSGATTIDFYQPSLDGQLVAVSLSLNGSEDGTLGIYEVATGRALGDSIPRVTFPTGGGSVAWNADGSGLYYTRYPQPGERPAEDQHFYQQVYFHQIGAPTADDVYVIGQDFPRIAEVELHSSDDGQFLLVQVANGDGGEFAHYLRGPEGEWTQVTHFADGVKQAQFAADSLLLLAFRDTPNGALLRVPLAAPVLAEAETLVPEGETAIVDVTPTATRIYLTEMAGGPSAVRVLGSNGIDQGRLPLAPVSAVGQVLALDGDTILYRSNTFVAPPAWYRFDPAEEEPALTALRTHSPADFSDTMVSRIFATGRDGTRVPINVMHRAGIALNGSNPTLLYAYGGYGICLAPFFDPGLSVWLEQGGVFAVANLRGGGEYGDAWHLAGNLTRKQTVFDDFLACAEHMVTAGYTNPERLAIMGGSNGGLLMGAALTQRPELFRAVVAAVGIYDMLRVELDPNGAFNITEFGTVAEPAQFAALYAYSPYHHVADGTAYPAVLFTTGDNDGRVNPAHSRKMTARLQAATASARLILLRTSASSGHGMGTSLNEQIVEETDVYTFLFDQLGMTYVAPEVAMAQ